MEIITRPTQKRFRQSGKKAPFRVLAVVLALVLTASMFAIGIPMASAKGESAFTDCEEIYIDMRSFTGWSENSAAFRVFTFWNDSNDVNYCREFPGNFDNDGWYDGQNVLQAGIKASKFCDNVYSFRIPSDKLSHLRIARTNSNSTVKWNLSPYMWDNQRSKTAGNRNNCIKINDWNNNATWTTFSPTNNASYSSRTATNVVNKSSSVKLFNIDATLYDYYTDDEVQNGWENIRYESGHSYWEPYQYLNKKIASASSDVNYPLYFGNFYGKNDGYAGEGASNMTNFSNWVNNSSNLDGANKSVVGLTGGKLSDSGDLVYAADGGVNSSVKVPIFDTAFLSNNKVGSTVNTKFPMRVTTDSAGNTKYVFDSGAGDNVWLSQDKTTMNYGQGNSHAAKDALLYYSAPQEQSGYGFFPFDYNRGATAEAYNFGFGMRTDIKFNVGANGLLPKGGGHEVFEFTGDDDLWVYLDGVLVLDLGGDHKKAHGTIDFNTMTSTVTTGVNTLNSATRNGSFPNLFGASGNQAFNNNDPTAEHTLTMFYVERGMVESNLSFNFNFSPVSNEFIVDKTVNTQSVNAGLQSTVAAADTFSFNQPTANGKTSSKGVISNSTYTLKDKESISFKDQFTRGQEFTVSETVPSSSKMTYTTSWKAVDLEWKKTHTEQQSLLGSGNTTTASFNYDTKNPSEFAMTRVQLSYTNTPAVAPVTITKTVNGLETGETDTTDFGGTVEVSLDGGSTWGAYALAYTATGVSGTKYLTANGALASGAKLRNGRTLTFAGIPRGAKVRFSEDSVSGYRTVSTTGGDNGITVGTGSNEIAVTNQRLSGAAAVDAIKTLDGTNYTGQMFSFTLTGLPPMTISGSSKTESTASYSETVTSITNGKVHFDLTGFNKEGIYRYVLKEEPISTGVTQVNKEISIDSAKRVYLVEVEMADSATGLTPSVTYFTYNAPAPYFNSLSGAWEEDDYTITAADFDYNNVYIGTPRFENKTQKVSVTVNKKDQKNATVNAATTFSLYKVSGDGAAVSPANKVETKDTVNGTVKFENLDLYEDGYRTAATAGALKYQWYALVEDKAPAGHNRSDEVVYFKFPINNSYNYTFSYINGKIINPKTAGEGNTFFKVLGWAVTGASVLSLAAYVVLINRKKRAFKHLKK